MPGQGFENSSVSVILWQSQRQEAIGIRMPSSWFNSGGRNAQCAEKEMLKFKFAIDLKKAKAHAEQMQLKPDNQAHLRTPLIKSYLSSSLLHAIKGD